MSERSNQSGAWLSGRLGDVECDALNNGKKLQNIVGLLLVAVGIVSLAYQRITYTSREAVVDIGLIQATAERNRTIPWPPVLGTAAIAGGVALLLVGRRRWEVRLGGASSFKERSYIDAADS